MPPETLDLLLTQLEESDFAITTLIQLVLQTESASCTNLLPASVGISMHVMILMKALKQYLDGPLTLKAKVRQERWWRVGRSKVQPNMTNM